jgi:hypothetical protein
LKRRGRVRGYKLEVIGEEEKRSLVIGEEKEEAASSS